MIKPENVELIYNSCCDFSLCMFYEPVALAAGMAKVKLVVGSGWWVVDGGWCVSQPN